MQDFRDFVAQNELVDLGYEGYPFTWQNNQEARPIQLRLDHGLATSGWHELYPDTTIRHIVLEDSDHALLLMSTEKIKAWTGRKFSFDARWSKMKECRDLVAGEWWVRPEGSHAFWFCEKMKKLRRTLNEWYRGRGRNSKKSIDHLKKEIRATYKSGVFVTNEVKLMERELMTAHKNEETYWWTKSKTQWLKEGDKNTKFFHAQTMKIRRSNQIRGLMDANGVWQENEPVISSIVTFYFSDLFRSGRPAHFDVLNNGLESRVTLEDNLALTAPVTEEEIIVAAFQIPPTRAPGPDGFSGCFYQDHWDTVGKDVIRIIKAFWHSGRLQRKLNHTNLVLIPKVKCPKNMTQYRPIALCNVIYKILAKVLTNRLKLVMPKAGMAIKLDMAKAYDRVEWNFLLSMMAKLGFAPLFCSWIMECISSTSFSFIINGTPTGFIMLERGLRQGDPLSPYLFLLCTEGLSMLIRNGLERGAINGYRVSPAGTPITHLFFADDYVLFGKATTEETLGILNILKTYARGSGQELNLSNSSIFFGSKILNHTRLKIGRTMGIQCKVGFGKYLSLQADFGHSKKVVFKEVRDRLETRMTSWAKQYLSQTGKETLVKAVAMAMPNHAMSYFKLPIGVCRDIEKVIPNFWWRGSDQRMGIHWLSWDRLKKQKRSGGLGFRDIQCFNLAFLAKIG
ncbi:hypothetical protein TB1_009061 [Malus domestica]